MDNARGIAIAVGAGLVALSVAYGGGRLQESAKIDDAERRAAASSSASNDAVAKAQSALAVERDRVTTLEARRRLHLAIMALEEKNFGTAQEQLDAASKLLSSLKSADPAVLKIAGEVTALKVVATDDVGEQRDKLLAICKKLDAVLPAKAD